MFGYFNRLDTDKNDGVGYRKRVEDRCEEIISSAFDNDSCFDEALNLETLAIMSLPKDKLKVPAVYAVSKFADDYEKYLNERFFCGMKPEEFEKDEQIMFRFQTIKNELRKKYTQYNKTEKYFDYLVPHKDENFEEYCKRIDSVLKVFKTDQYVHIEDLFLSQKNILLNVLIKNDTNDFMLDERLIDIEALNLSISELKLDFSDYIKRGYEATRNLKSSLMDVKLFIYGFFLMKDYDLYNRFIKNKSTIYQIFGAAYNDRLYDRKTSSNHDDFHYEDSYQACENLPNRQRMVKPNNERGFYGSFYASEDQMWDYKNNKRISELYADIILERGINYVIDDINYTLRVYKGTEEEECLKKAICGIPKVLRRKNNKLSNKTLNNIENMLKSI